MLSNSNKALEIQVKHLTDVNALNEENEGDIILIMFSITNLVYSISLCSHIDKGIGSINRYKYYSDERNR